MSRPNIIRGIAIPDTHIPYHDQRAINLIYKAIELYKPNMVVHLGDLMDAYPVSRFDKDPMRKFSLADEIRQTGDFLDETRDVIQRARKGTPMVLLEGNHEDRVRRFIWSNASALVGIEGMLVEEMLRVKQRGWQWVPFGKFHDIGPITFCHGESAAKYATARSLDKLMVPVIFGHTHRLQRMAVRTLKGKVLEALTGGCICDLDVEYAHHHHWAQGFTTFEIIGDDYWINFHRFSNGYKVRFMGETLQA